MLLEKWNDCGPITDPKDHAFLSRLLSGHINAKQKSGVGVHCFFVDKASFGTSCFFVRRKDFTETDFGISSCLKSCRRINMESFRAVVWPQICKFRKQFTGDFFISEYSGKRFPISELHIDHVPHFVEIVDSFCLQNGIDINKPITVPVDNSFEPVWEDASIPERFTKYHDCVARLRPVSAGENTGELNKRWT